MSKLSKKEFDDRYRFREARTGGLVACASCANCSETASVSGPLKKVDLAKCLHSNRFRPVQLAKSWGSYWGKGDSGEYTDLSKDHVCDVYQNRPLPEEVQVPTLAEGQGVVLNTQWRDCLHIDATCPYVVEEARLKSVGGKAEIRSWPDYMRTAEITIVDTTEVVPGECHQDACDMPCCESKLQFQIWNPNGYRDRVGIHPNARDPRYFVRNALYRHGRISNMSFEEAEEFFRRVGEVAESAKEGGVHDQIVAVSNYMHEHENHLGSRPLSEAVNPVFLSGYFSPLAAPKWWKDDCYWIKYDSAGTGADVWMYDKRLFNREKADGQDFRSLDPEGIIPCVDSKGVFRNVKRVHSRASEGFNLRGILRPVENREFLLKGSTHFLDIREVSYDAHEHYWGESGIGFSDTESFHEE